MLIAVSIVLLLFLLCVWGFAYASIKTREIERDHPNTGVLTDIGGYRINHIHLPEPDGADLPPLVFIHGASGNLKDQIEAFAEPLKGRAAMLFIDRPGHGYSERGGPENALPSGQADALAELMTKLSLERAIIVGHSFGGAIAAAFAVRHPQRTAGLLFLAPATHPWPGGVDWYYTLSTIPVLGWLFTHTLLLPIGIRRLEQGTLNVFGPNPRPEGYVSRTAPSLVLRPRTFLYNAQDVVNLLAYVRRESPHYKDITAPTVIITGDRDDIVLAELHSLGLERDIPGAELVTIHDLGHKPDYITTDVAIAAIEKIAGRPHDLAEYARKAEERIARQLRQPSP